MAELGDSDVERFIRDLAVRYPLDAFDLGVALQKFRQQQVHTVSRLQLLKDSQWQRFGLLVGTETLIQAELASWPARERSLPASNESAIPTVVSPAVSEPTVASAPAMVANGVAIAPGHQDSASPADIRSGAYKRMGDPFRRSDGQSLADAARTWLLTDSNESCVRHSRGLGSPQWKMHRLTSYGKCNSHMKILKNGQKIECPVPIKFTEDQA